MLDWYVDCPLDTGTYVKSFYTVMHCPSFVRVGVLSDHRAAIANVRLHHSIDHEYGFPKILRESIKK